MQAAAATATPVVPMAAKDAAAITVMATAVPMSMTVTYLTHIAYLPKGELA